eukprot:403339455
MESQIKKYLILNGLDQILIQAFQELRLTKPQDPILFLSSYLQERSHLFDNEIISQENNQESVSKQTKLDQEFKSNLIENQSEIEVQKYKELLKPFKLNHQKTITVRPIAGIIQSQNYAVALKLTQISEEPNQIQESEDDDFFLEPTEKPMAGIKMNTSKSHYVTTNIKQLSTQVQTHQDLSSEYLRRGEFSKLYNYDQVYKKLHLSFVAQQYEHEYGDMKEQILNRCFNNQSLILVDYNAYDRFSRTLFEPDLVKYLRERSQKYHNVISISELARGGEAIVYRLEYLGTDEVVIKTTQIEDKLDNYTMMQQSFIEIMTETQHLKLLQSDKYIAKVQEEIIEYDEGSQSISRYCVIVERAQYSLYDLLKIWKSEELSLKYMEYFSHEKLAYYFYQALEIIEYLHQRDIYYGDMKPHNLLVFRDQQVKVGDLGISIKLDSSKLDTEEIYQINGMSRAYASTEMALKLQQRAHVSKKQLFSYDKYCLIRTFQQCIDETKDLIKHDSDYSSLCQQMLNDLLDNSFKGMIRKYSSFFANDSNYLKNLITVMNNEYKFDAIDPISYYSKYGLILKEVFQPKFQEFLDKQSHSQQASKIVQIPNLDILQDYYDTRDFYVLEQLNTSNNQINKFKQILTVDQLTYDLEFKKLLIEMFHSIQERQDVNGKCPFSDKYPILPYFQKYFCLEKTLDNSNLIIKWAMDGIKLGESFEQYDRFIEDNFEHFLLYLDWIEITVKEHKIIGEITEILNNKLGNTNRQCITPYFLKFWILQTVNEYYFNFDPTQNYMYSIAYMYEPSKTIGNLKLHNRVIQILIECCNQQGQYQQTLQQFMDFADPEKANDDKFYDNIKISIMYMQTMKMAKECDRNQIIQIGQAWLERCKTLCGEAHKNTLKLYGIVGEELLANNSHDKQSPDFQTGLIYLSKFSKLSLETFLKTLTIIQKFDMETIIKQYLSSMTFSLKDFHSDYFMQILEAVYLQQHNQRTTLKILRVISDYQVNFENICKNDVIFETFMRYLKSLSINVEGNTYEIVHQEKYVYESDNIQRNITEKVKILKTKCKYKLQKISELSV